MTTRLWIGGPTRDSVPASFALDLAQLYAKSKEHVQVVLGFVGATYVHVGREWVLKAALQHQATHILWTDTDMRFPPEAALLLLTHDKPVVAANYVMRTPQPLFTAMRDGERIETGADSTGLEEVDVAGMGLMLMRTDVAAELPFPRFVHGQNEIGEDIGEDVMFCRALRQAGIAIHIDHDLSKGVGHVGQFVFGLPCVTPKEIVHA